MPMALHVGMGVPTRTAVGLAPSGHFECHDLDLRLSNGGDWLFVGPTDIAQKGGCGQQFLVRTWLSRAYVPIMSRWYQGTVGHVQPGET
ncbi:MAG: hypothetical protein KKB50_04530 [Planctomycetes bacterium]|nr:hypothetical protein [Planctomycetota bacterium]